MLSSLENFKTLISLTLITRIKKKKKRYQKLLSRSKNSIGLIFYWSDTRIQSECGKMREKMRTRITSNTDTFYAVFSIDF